MREVSRSASMARRSSLPGPTRCVWPTNSSSVRGRMRTAKGFGICGRAGASVSNRSLAGVRRVIVVSHGESVASMIGPAAVVGSTYAEPMV